MKTIYEHNKKYDSRETSISVDALLDKVLEKFKEKAFPKSKMERVFGHSFFKSPYLMPIASEMMDRTKRSLLFHNFTEIAHAPNQIKWEPYSLAIGTETEQSIKLAYWTGLKPKEGMSTVLGEMHNDFSVRPLEQIPIEESVAITDENNNTVYTDGRKVFNHIAYFLRDDFLQTTSNKDGYYSRMGLALHRLKNRLKININGYTERIDRKISIHADKLPDRVKNIVKKLQGKK